MAIPFIRPDDEREITGTFPHFISEASIGDLRSNSQRESFGL
jgi:hypothetical protein